MPDALDVTEPLPYDDAASLPQEEAALPAPTKMRWHPTRSGLLNLYRSRDPCAGGRM